MKKNILTLGLILILLCFFLEGCALKETSANDECEEVIMVEGDYFTPQQVASFYDSKHNTTYIYLKDKITNVMYLCMEEDHSMGGFDGTSGVTVMLDPETGGPLLYDKWLEYVDQAEVEKILQNLNEAKN